MDTQTAAVKTFGQRGVRAAPTPYKSAARKPSPTVVAEEDEAPSDAERFLALLPILTFGLAVGLLMIFAAAQMLAFDVGPGASLSQESLTALGAASFDLAIVHKQLWRLLLAPLLHASASHVIGNCVAMALVGFRLEPIIGRGWFALIFAASALGGMVGSMIGNPADVTTVGASGAITGLVAATFVMSFHERADTDDVWKMRRRALFFGVPALLPLFLGARGHTDYHAHFGGALVGTAIALALVVSWNGHSFRPRWAGRAAKVAFATLAASALACGFIPLHYREQAAIAATVMPDSLGAAPSDELTARAGELASRYPEDPRARLLQATAFVKGNQFRDAEDELRQVMTMPWPARRGAEVAVHKRAQAVLAVVLAYDHQQWQARELVHSLCDDADAADMRPMLVKAKLCPG